MREKGRFWKVEWRPSKRIKAGIASLWTADFVAEEEIKQGGILRFLPDYLRVHWEIGEFYFSTEADCDIEHRVIYPSIYRENPVLEGEIKKGKIQKGRKIRMILGNYSGTGPDMVAPKLAFADMPMTLWVKLSPGRDFIKIAEIIVSIVPSDTKAINFYAVSPSDENTRFRLAAVDAFLNHTPDFKDKVDIISSAYSGKKQKLQTVSMEKGLLRINGLRHIKQSCPVFLHVECKERKVLSRKIMFYPGFFKDIGKNVYFGDLHIHCNGSWNDAMNSPEWAYRYAMDVSGLGFCSLTDHFYHLMRTKSWQRERKACRKATKAGEFVAFLGYEYDHCSQKGHLGVHFKADVPEVITGTSYKDFLTQLKKSGYEAFICPHHPNALAEHLPLREVNAWRNFDWDCHDEAIPSLCEVFQERGSFEKEDLGEGVFQGGYGASLQSALKRGYHIGCCGGSDTHLGRPGASPFHSWGIPLKEVKIGLTAVLADHLTSDSIWEALKNRNAYVTTGTRMLLNFRVDGLIMGERKDVGREIEQVPIKIRIAGTAKIVKVIIIRNGKALREFAPDEVFFETVIIDEDPDFSCLCLRNGKKGHHAYYYLRVTQEDGHRAWSSPIFLCLD